jgi:hypothetical protein
LFICFCSTMRVWTPSLGLARQALYHLSHILRPFCFSYFSDRVLQFLFLFS